MTSSRVIIILSIIAGAAAAGLGFTAFRLTRHEQQYRLAEMRGILQSECRVLAERCRNELENFQTQLRQAVENTAPTVAAVNRLRQDQPLIRETFIANAHGRLLYPRDGGFFRRYEALFDEPIGMTGTPKANNGQMTANGKSLINNAKPSSGSKNDGQMTTRFGQITDGRSHGWVPWFAGNRFCPLIWAKCRTKTDRIVGAELETVVMLSRLVPLFPQSFPRYYRFELVDAQGRCIVAAGFNPAAGEGRTPQLDPAVVLPVADSLAPNWQVRGYLVPQGMPGDRFRFALWLQIASLLVVIAAAGGIMLGLVRREMELARKKTGFVANVSHELKTPLTSIRMYAEMMLDNADRLSQEKRHKYLGVILSESERLTRLIANVLDFSRLEAGRKRYRPDRVGLNELTAAVAEQWRPALDAAGMRLDLQLPETERCAAIDRDSLVQVLQNLLANAVKYAASGGEITITLTPGAPGQPDRITVADRGPGVPPACRRRLFRKFYRGDDRITAETSGSGLGLAIARRLLRDQRGDLVFSPNPGGGAAFTLVIPGGDRT